MKMKSVGISKSREGEVLKRNIYGLDGLLILSRGHLITRQDIEDSAGKIMLEDNGEEIPDPQKQSKETATIQLDTPFETLAIAMSMLGGLFNSLGNPKADKDFASKVATIGMTLSAVCKIDEDLALSTTIMEQNQKYPVVHSIQVAIVCEIVSKKLDWPPDTRASLLAAALTMNVAMLSLQNILYRQNAPLTENQKDVVRAHPVVGAGMLRDMSVTDTVWLDTVLQHHESIDGTGYPHGLKGDKICKTARLLSLADLYCARVTGRQYRASLSPVATLKDIYLGKGHKVDTELAMSLIKTMGIFPPGMFVKLKNCETAIVTHRGERANKPLVHTIIKANGSCLMSPIRRDTSIDEFSIVSDLPAARMYVNVNCHQLWGYGIFKKARSTKRKHRRVHSDLPVKILDLHPIRVTDAYMLNISQSGCLLRLPYHDDLRWALEKDYYLTFRLNDKTIENVVGNVRNVKIKGEEQFLGFEFINLDEAAYKHVKHFVSELRKKGETQHLMDSRIS
ncbi:MAG: PilZ domain-containing protein [Nitrospirae bacterium]|nr:PilZ domain-containing protein [Nitrospirota bacterium]